MQCTTMNTIFHIDRNPVINVALRIGLGFSGYMRKIKIYDYPKEEVSMDLMYKVAPQ